MDKTLTLSEIQGYVHDIFEQEQFISTPRELYVPIDYTLRLGGKRIRPVMLLASCQMFGGQVAQARNAAIGIEVFHNFTLIHDDLMDLSPLRRGKETVYRKWNANTAILSGDAMLIMAYQYLVRQESIDISDGIACFNQMANEVMQGQQYDINFEQRDDVSVDEYIEMIYLKTAALFNGALRIGALFGNPTDEDLARLYDFGKHLGLAFQIQDDLLDTYGDLAAFGKQPGQDIRDNKKTILLLSALQKASPEQKEELKSWMQRNTPSETENKVQQVKAIYDSLNIKHDIESLINQHYIKAGQALDEINVADGRKQALRQLMQELLHRAK